MREIIIKKIKKYLLFISGALFTIILLHLSYLYLYEGAESEAIEWWSISEAIIWNFPHFNPLIPSNDHNAYINRLLYRSILEYSTSSGWLEADLMNCNLENLLYIECTLENNLTWSDGSSITVDDIISTLNIIKETQVNPIIASLLEDTTIESSENSISFSRDKKDINILYLFMQPILPQSMIEDLNNENVGGKFSEIWALYSGRFRLININRDETLGVTKLTFWKNEEYYENDLYIEFLILNLYRDESHFLKNKNAFNLFNDSKNILGDNNPRLENFEYITPQFTSVFLNSENIWLNLRKYISSNIKRDVVISQVWEKRVLPSYNPFLSKVEIDATTNPDYNLSEALASLGYYSKTDILKQSIAQEQASENNISEESSPTTENNQEENPQEQKVTQKTLSYIVSPTDKKYNFVSEDNILIQWKVDPGTDSVYINDYKLSGFSQWDDVFYYRLLESYDSISLWENSYKIYFWNGKEKKFIEEFVYIYETDTEKLRIIEEEYFTWEDDTWENSENEEGNLSEKAQSENTVQEKEIDEEIFTLDIENLDDTLYYNAQGEAFSLTLIYAQNDAYHEITATTIVSQLEAAWINIELRSMSLGDITKWLRSEELQYDLLLLWVDLGFLESDIFPYFHSSQVSNGYNISNFKKLSLDILLEELKSNRISETKQKELTDKILEILKEESIIHTLYTPKLSLYVDKNIKNFIFPSFLPDSTFRYFPLTQSYLSEKKMIHIENKSIPSFLWFIWKLLSQS